MVDLDPIWDLLVEPTPGVPGVYFLFNEEWIVYVGMAAQPCVRIATHRENGIAFTEAMVMPVYNKDDRLSWEGALIAHLRPPLNRTNVKREIGFEEFVNLRDAGFTVRGWSEGVRR